MHRKILMDTPSSGAPPNGRFGADASFIVEVSEGLPHSEITGRADVYPANAARQEPLSRPASKSTYGDQTLDDVLVGAPSKGAEVQLPRVDALGQVHDVLRLPRRELHTSQLADSRASHHCRLGKRIDRFAVHGNGGPKASHQPPPHGEGKRQIDLPGGYPTDPHLQPPRGQPPPQPVAPPPPPPPHPSPPG